MIIPLPQYKRHLARARAPLPLPHIFYDTTNRYKPLPRFAVFLARPKSPISGRKQNVPYYCLKRFVRFRHNDKELMKESHTKDKGDIGLDREELAPGGTSL